MTSDKFNNADREASQETVFGSRSEKKTLIVLGIVTTLYLALNVSSAIMGIQNLDAINSIIVLPLILGIVALTFNLRRRMVAGSANHTLWTGMTSGAAFWAIAECWWALGILTGSDIPFPSGADFFWLIAYIPMTRALWIRIHSLPRNSNQLWKGVMWIVSLLTVALTVALILIPLIQTYDPSSLLESILNLLYPLGDLLLLLMTLWILSAYQQGMYGQAWVWISGGFILIAASDLFFSYSSMVGTYYPDGQANLISILLVDVPYALGYLGWLVGLLVLRDMLVQHHPLAINDQHFDLVPNTHMFIAIREDSSVISISQNMLRIFPVDNQWNGRALSHVLGMTEDTCDAMLAALRMRGALDERSITVTTRLGRQEAHCSGIAIFNPQGKHTGASLLVRMLMQDNTLDELLTDEQISIVRHIKNKTGVLQKEEEEIKRLLTRYYLAYIKALYNRSLAEGGAVMADALLAELLDTAQRHAWQVTLHPETLLDVSALALPATQAALPLLVDASKRFVARLTDDPTADSVIQEIQSQIDGAVHKNVLRYS